MKVPASFKNLTDESEVPLMDIYEYLRQFHLSESLYEVGSLNAILRYGFREKEIREIPHRITSWFDKMIKEGQPEEHLLLLFSRLARFLILSGANDYSSHILIVGTPPFMLALNAIRLLNDKDVEAELSEDGKISAFASRLAAWQLPLLEKRLVLIGRAFLLFRDIPALLSTSYSFNDKLKEYYSISVEEFIWTGLSLWFQTNGVIHETMEISVAGLKEIVTKHTIKIFKSLSSGTPREYRIALRGGRGDEINKKVEYYALDPFIKMPIIKVNNPKRLSDGTFLIPQAKYLQDRTCYGIFHLLAEKEEYLAKSKGLTGENPFRRTFGVVYKEYVLHQLKSSSSNVKVIDLDKEFPTYEGKIPDIALVYEDSCVLFEIKTTLLPLAARTYFNDKDLISEVSKKKGNFDKALKQLDSFKSDILTGKVASPIFENVKKIVRIIVCYEDIPLLNLVTLPLLKNKFGSSAEDLQLATPRDIEKIADTLYTRPDIPGLLMNKIADPETEHWMIATFLNRLPGLPNQNRMLYEKFREVMGSLGLSSIPGTS